MLTLLITPVFILFSLLFPTATFAQTTREWTGRCVVQGDVATIQGLECLFYNLLQVITSIAGIAFFIMFIIGGFQYLTSGGDQKKTAQASSTLTLTVMGLVGTIGAYFILKLIETFTGVRVTEFIIPGP